jgi:hypothetical protein
MWVVMAPGRLVFTASGPCQRTHALARDRAGSAANRSANPGLTLRPCIIIAPRHCETIQDHVCRIHCIMASKYFGSIQDTCL